MSVASGQPSLTFWECGLGHPPAPIVRARFSQLLRAGQGVVWVDMQMEDEADARKQLSSCGLSSLTDALVGLLVDVDDRFDRVATGTGNARALVWPSLRCEYAAGHAPVLRTVRVGVAADDHWLVTVRHSDEMQLETLRAAVGSGRNSETGRDVAVRVLSQLGASFQTAAAALDDAFHRLHPKSNETLYKCAAVRGSLDAIVSGVSRQALPAEHAWFEVSSVDAGTAQQLRQLLNDTAKRLDTLGGSVRAAVEGLATEHEERRSKALGALFGVLASVFLGPTLIATIFSAFPGWLGEGYRPAALALLCAASIVFTALLVWLVPMVAARSERRPWTRPVIGTAVAGVAVIAVLVAIALPLGGGLDDAAPYLRLTCPRGPLQQGSEASMLIAASDADSKLVNPPGPALRLDTMKLGPNQKPVTVMDEFGHSRTAACAYTVEARPEAAVSGSP